MSQSTSKWLIDVGSLLKFERNVFTRFCQPLVQECGLREIKNTNTGVV